MTRFRAALLVIGLSTACTSPEAERTVPAATSATGAADISNQLVPIPWPDLAKAESQVKEQIGPLRTALEQRQASSSPDPRAFAEDHGRVGVVFIAYEFLEAAEACFRNAGALAEEDPRWPYLLGYLLKMQGQLEEAAPLLELALALEPENWVTRVRLGDTYFELGRHELARDHYGAVLDSRPEEAAVHAGLGRMAVAEGDDSAAVEHLLRALEIQPGATSLHYPLGQTYRRLGELEQAGAHLAKRGDITVRIEDPLLDPIAVLGRSAQFYLDQAGRGMENGRYDIAAENFRQALEYDPEAFRAYRGLAFSLAELGDRSGAMVELRRGLERGRTGGDSQDRWQQAEIHRLLGELLVLDGNDGGAIVEFRRALELRSDRLDAVLLLANALARSGELDEAVSLYDRLLAAQPANAATRLRRATALINLGREAEALVDFEAAVAAEPSNAEIRLRFAEALDYLGRPAEAREQRALARSEGDELAGVLAEADALVARGGFEEAHSLLQEALGRSPESLDLRLRVARLQGHLGNYAGAAEIFGRLRHERPRLAEPWRGEISALILLERYGEARERFREALENFPRDAQLAHGLARLLAIAPGAGERNAALAVDLSQRVLEARNEPATQETLAMALAESGKQREAAALQRQVLTAVGGGDDLQRSRLEAYERGEAWRLSSPDEILSLLLPGGA